MMTNAFTAAPSRPAQQRLLWGASSPVRGCSTVALLLVPFSMAADNLQHRKFVSLPELYSKFVHWGGKCWREEL